MAEKTSIAWTNSTWNPVRGCSRVSEGCRNCYAERVAARFSGKGQPYEGLAVMKSNGPHWTGEVRLVEEHLEDPLKWRKPRMVFVNSMSDLFHEGLDFGDIRRVFDVMRNAPQHVFQVLTKRPERMLEFVQDCMTIWQYSGSTWPFERLYPNVWLGVSVENQETADERIPHLLHTPASVRFISAEPLLGRIDLTNFLAANYNPMHEAKTKRRVCLPSSKERGFGDRRSGQDLESEEAQGQPLDRSSTIVPVQESEGRARHGRLLSNQNNDKSRSSLRTSSQGSVDSLLWRDSDRTDNQSQEWKEEGQQTGKSRNRNLFGASVTRNPCPQEEPTDAQSVGGAQSHEQAEQRASSRNQGTQAQGRTPEINSDGLRDSVSNGIKDSQRHSTGGINWTICGGESGPHARPCDIQNIRLIVEQCRAADVACFVKQLGSKPFMGVKGFGPDIKDKKGGEISEFPEDLRVRQFPHA